LESKWQWNVAYYGMSGMGYKRVARLLLLPSYVMAQFEDREASGYALYYAPVPGQFGTYIGTYNNGNLHFPFGVPVEPD